MGLILFCLYIAAPTNQHLKTANDYIGNQQFLSALEQYEEVIRHSDTHLLNRTLVYWQIFTIKIMYLDRFKPDEIIQSVWDFRQSVLLIEELVEDDMMHPRRLFFMKHRLKMKYLQADCIIKRYWETKNVAVFSGCTAGGY